MKKTFLNKIIGIIIFYIFLLFSKINHVFAQLSDTQSIDDQDKALMKTASFDSSFTIGAAVATVIKAFLGLLGIIFIFLMVYAGYHWMTAAGDEQKVTKAKDTLRTAIIGLIIIVAAYSITYFVIKALGSAAGSGGGSMSTGG